LSRQARSLSLRKQHTTERKKNTHKLAKNFKNMNIILAIILRILLFYLGLLSSLGNMSLITGSQTTSFFYRILASYGALTVCALYGVFASLILRLFGCHRISQWATARAFKYSMALTAGVKFRIIGGQQHLSTRPAIFVGNHQTALDVLLLGEIFPKWCSVTAKKQLKRVPFLGWFMALSGTVFIDRGNRATAMKAFEGAAKEITQKKQSVFIFPEGTRSNAAEPTLLPFKKGAFHLAVQAKVPIVPVVVACYTGVLSAKEWRFRRGEIPVIGLLFLSSLRDHIYRLAILICMCGFSSSPYSDRKP
jgi:lysophosphatidate acyltransferase